MDTRRLAELAQRKHDAAFEAAGHALAYDMAIITVIEGKSALDKLAELGEADLGPANADPTHPGLLFPPKWTNAPDITPKLVGLDGIKVTIEKIPGVGHDLTLIELGLNNVPSSQVSAFGCDVRAYSEGEEAGDEAGAFVNIARVFVRFKGGGIYRYYPLHYMNWRDLVSITRQMMQGLDVTQTVGEYVNQAVKVHHEQGNAVCEKFDPANNAWTIVLTREQRKVAKGGAQGSNEMFALAERNAHRIWASIYEYDVMTGASVDESQQQVENPVQTQEASTANMSPDEDETVVELAESLKQIIPPEGHADPLELPPAPAETEETPQPAPTEEQAPLEGEPLEPGSVMAQGERTSAGLGSEAEF